MLDCFRFLSKNRNTAGLASLRARIKFIFVILVIVCTLIGMSPTSVMAAGTTYYVNNTVACSDSGSGTSGSPFCTIAKGASMTVPGDTVQVVAGTYAETVLPKSGSAGSPVTLTAAPGVIVTGAPGATSSGGAFRLSTKSYVVIDGFTISHTADNGITVDSSNNITISDNHISYSGSPVSGSNRYGIDVANTTNSKFTGNTLDHNSFHGILLSGGCTNNEISDNIAFANAEEWQRNANGIRLDGSTNNTIQHNIVYGNEDSGLQFYTGSSNNSIIENLAYGNGDHGIDNNASPNNSIIGNTVQGNVTSGINLEGATAPGSGGATVANNIMVDNGFLRQVGGGTASGQPSNFRADSQSLTGTNLDYNLYYLSSGTDQITWDGSTYATLGDFHTAQPLQEVHGLQANPLFVSPAPVAQRPASAPFNVAVNSGNYHLSYGSQAIDSANSGAPGEPTTDIEGNARADDPDSANTGAGPRTYDDRGVYEYQPVAKVLPTVTTQAVSSIGSTTATGNGNVTALGVPNPTQHGVVWSTAANPTTANSKTSDGSVGATGAFTSAMTGLTPGTLYHVRAYAINAAGTAYGGDVSFTTLPTSTSITTPATNAGTGADGGGSGTTLWSHPEYITADDTSYATYNVGTNTTSHYLNGTNYGFNIPAGATIKGIQVSIGRFADSNRIQDDTVQLIKAGTRTGSNLSTGSAWPTSMTAANFGSTSNLWGTTWVPADINASNFGVSLRVANSSGSINHTPSVDYMQISVTYSVSSGGSSTTVNCGAGTPVVTYGSTITCLVTVTAGSGTTSPTGSVSWTAGGNGTFVTSPCSLSGSGGTATCSVTYKPNLVGTGTHTVTANYAGDGSFLSSSGNQSVTVNPLALVPGITAGNKIYDATNTATILTRTLTGVVGTDVVSLIGGTATFDTKNVGTGKTVTAIGLSLSGTNAGNYTVNPSATTLADITPKALAVTATGINRPYDGTLVATVSLSTDALVGDTVTPAYTSAAFATKDVANGIAVSVTGITISGLDAVNYSPFNTTAATTANITPLAITGNITASDKAYDGNTSATILTRTLTGVIGTDVVNYIGGTATFNTKNVGTAKTVTATGMSLSGAAAGNYTVNTTATTTASITSIAITGNITASNKIYNGNTSATILTRTLTGVIGTDVVNYTGGTATFDTKNVGTGKTVTATGLSLSGADAVNYTVNPSATAIADITPKGLTVTATGVNRPYDGTLVATVTLTTDALVGDTVTPAYTAASFTTKDIGNGKAVSVTGILLGGLDVSNYYLLNTTAATTANITPLALTGNITASDKVYDFNTNATILTRTLTGVVGTDVVNYIGGTATFNTKNVGTGKTVTAVGLSLSGAGASNYTVNTTATTTASITPTTITGNITASNKVYDGNTSATIATRTLIGVIGTDVVNYTGGTAIFDTKNIGTGKTVTVTGLSLSGADAGNYTVNTSAATTANITIRDLTVAATADNKIYDGTTHAVVHLTTNAASGDIVTTGYTSAEFATPDIGSNKTVTVLGISIGGADAGNYHLLNTTATATADITVAGVGMYDGMDISWTYVGNWANLTTSGPYANTLNYSSTIGDYALFTMSGSQFTLYYAQYTNRGLIDVYVDNVKVHTIDSSGSLMWQDSWTSGNLGAGTHNLKFVHVSGTYIDIDALQVLGPDTTAPAAITNLAAAPGVGNGSVNLTWTAPGDDNNTGTATSYLVRYATTPILTQANWNAASSFAGSIPTPKAAGGSESMVVDGLTPSTLYYFAVRAQDEVPNLGNLSNSPNATATFIAPQGPGTYDGMDSSWAYVGNWANLTTSGPYANTLNYSSTIGDYALFTMSGSQFTLYYAQYTNRGLIDVYVDNVKVHTIDSSGSLMWQDSWTSGNLGAGTHNLKFVHVSGTYIDIDALQVLGPDTTAPAAITNLAAAPGVGNGSVNLTWTAPGDDNNTGTATSYLVRYATTPILTQANWNAASSFAGSIPTPKAAGGSESMVVDGLTPSTLYYFAVRAQDEVPNLGNLSNSPSATATYIAPPGVGIYDGMNSSWTYVGNWANLTTSGPYANTLNYSSTIGDYATFTMSGSQFTLYYAQYTNRGLIDVYVDNVKVHTIDSSGSLMWQDSWTSGNLGAGTHNLKFVHVSGTYIDMDAIQVLPAPAGVGTYDGMDSSWSYVGNWANLTTSGPYANTLNYSSTIGDYATFTMSGSQFTLYYAQYTNRGLIDVYVDNVKVTTIDSLGSLVWQDTWTSGNLGAGTHNLKFVHVSGTYIDMDAIQIMP